MTSVWVEISAEGVARVIRQAHRPSDAARHMTDFEGKATLTLEDWAWAGFFSGCIACASHGLMPQERGPSVDQMFIRARCARHGGGA